MNTIMNPQSTDTMPHYNGESPAGVMVLDLSNRFVSANVAANEGAFSGSILATGVDNDIAQSAIQEVSSLYETGMNLIRSVRDSLYEFLGCVYEKSAAIGENKQAVNALRHYVRGQFESTKDKTRVEEMDVSRLLLICAMGVEGKSLRSKYAALIKHARAQSVVPTKDAFKEWISRSGGIVKALQPAVKLLNLNDTQGEPASVKEDHSPEIAQLRADLNCSTVSDMPSIGLIENTRPFDHFAVVVYRFDGSCLVPCLTLQSTKAIAAVLGAVVRTQKPSQAQV